ncbi:Rh-like protein/ammonium transporter [Rhizopogon vinicolor AM-OR11-026]|uniref:Rh-like protein/ammonium transporter n=1 Tax=Rhizopogon vinicolor AM-OR11-026 TaxID=1314800 RepID=A0A1B7NFK4_9AGAM|nr:Rh-like protein/ammonium transporter [Rhizopogon vinicolor AM-OR11-026]
MVPMGTKEVLNTTLKKRDDIHFDSSDISFIIVASAMVSFMTPGIAFLYSGLAKRKPALSLIWVVSASNAVGILQWYFWGYSLSFSPTASNGFIGNLENFGLMNVLGGPSPDGIRMRRGRNFGGGPVEIASGVGGLAYALVLGRRQDKEFQKSDHTVFPWLIWARFNGGSAFGANMHAVMVMFNSMLSAAAGGIVWCSLDYRLQHKFSNMVAAAGSRSRKP